MSRVKISLKLFFLYLGILQFRDFFTDLQNLVLKLCHVLCWTIKPQLSLQRNPRTYPLQTTQLYFQLAEHNFPSRKNFSLCMNFPSQYNNNFPSRKNFSLYMNFPSQYNNNFPSRKNFSLCINFPSSTTTTSPSKDNFSLHELPFPLQQLPLQVRTSLPGKATSTLRAQNFPSW